MSYYIDQNAPGDGFRGTEEYGKKENPYEYINAFRKWNNNDTIFYHNNEKKESLLEIINRRVAELPQHEDFEFLNPETNIWMKEFIKSIPTIEDIEYIPQPEDFVPSLGEMFKMEYFYSEYDAQKIGTLGKNYIVRLIERGCSKYFLLFANENDEYLGSCDYLLAEYLKYKGF